MKTDELRAQGLTDEQIAFIMAENGKDIAKVKSDVEAVTAERDKLKAQMDTAEETLKGFEGVDVAQLKADVESYKKKASDIEDEYNRKLADRDFNDAVNEAIRSAQGKNAKAIRALLDIEALKASKNQKADIESAIKALTEAEDSKMLFGVTTEADKKKARFTDRSSGSGGTVTKESIMAIADRTERRKAIAEHIDLFNH